MIVKEQKPIKFINNCDCIVDYVDLENAIIWYSDKPVTRLKNIFMYGNYPAISIYREKIHVHRLLMMYWENRKLKTTEHVHHKDENKLNALKENLEILSDSEHLSNHNKGRSFSDSHKEKIAKANAKRKGIKMKRKVNIPLIELKSLLDNGVSISGIAKKYDCDWSTVKRIINENPELLDGENL